MRPWILYSLARLGIFAVVLAVLLPVLAQHLDLRFAAAVAAVIAAVVAFCVSYLALGRLRAGVTQSIAATRTQRRRRSADEEAEDAAVDGVDEPAASAEPTPTRAAPGATPTEPGRD